MTAAPAEVVGVPAQMVMEQKPAMGASLMQHFQGPGLTVKQTLKGCFQECCGCEAQSEYKISAYDGDFAEGGNRGTQQPDIMYALEESSFITRLCCPSMRPLEINVSQGAEKGGPLVVKYSKGWNCPLCFSIPAGEGGTIDVPCCCMLPKLQATDPSGRVLGEARYLCDIFMMVPKFGYFENDRGNDAMIYYVAPETCCGGCCVMFRCGGKGGKAVYIPFLIRDPNTKEPIEDAGIAKLWSGMKKECCGDADNFALKWPSTSTPDRRAGLLGLNFLIDLVWFETHK